MSKRDAERLAYILWSELLRNPSFHFDAARGDKEFTQIVAYAVDQTVGLTSNLASI